MARGEKPTPRAEATGMAFVGVFGVAALGAVLFVILTTRACAACDQWISGSMAPYPTDPYLGASTAARLLHWRDTSRLRATLGAPPALDGPAAHYALERVLEERGYSPATESRTITMPADLEVPELEGACGVLEIEAEATSRITSAGRGTSLRVADDPSVIALGVCGEGPFRVEGVGTALARAHLLPGLVPSDVERTGLPEDVLLAHAEAEALLASVAYTPSDDVLRVDVTTPGAVFPSLPEPATGCVPWAVVVVGAGLAGGTIPGTVGDFASERALALLVSCAGGAGTTLSVIDAAGDGFVAWARPYEVASSPTMPTERTLAVNRAHVVDASSVHLPRSVPAAPMP